jgi:site-specific recombinase XerD
MFFELHKTKTWKQIKQADIDEFWAWKNRENEKRKQIKQGRGVGRIASSTYSSSTLNSVYAALRRFFMFAEREKFAKSISFARQNKWNPPTIDLKAIPRLLTIECVKKGYSDAGREPNVFLVTRDHLLVNFLFATGARISECSKLKIEHLRIDVQKPDVLLFGKKNKERRISLSTKWIELFKNYMEMRNDTSEYVFVNKAGNRLAVGTLKTLFRQAAAAAGISSIKSAHRLRHAYATALVKRGEDVTTVQRALGHADLNTTGRYLDKEKGAVTKSPLDDLS